MKTIMLTALLIVTPALAGSPGYHEPAVDSSDWTGAQVTAWSETYFACYRKHRPRDKDAVGALPTRQEQECQNEGITAAQKIAK